MQAEIQDISQSSVAHYDDTEIISEAIMSFSENSEINEGMCSCVCINDERCCGCLLQ